MCWRAARTWLVTPCVQSSSCRPARLSTGNWFSRASARAAPAGRQACGGGAGLRLGRALHHEGGWAWRGTGAAARGQRRRDRGGGGVAVHSEPAPSFLHRSSTLRSTKYAWSAPATTFCSHPCCRQRRSVLLSSAPCWSPCVWPTPVSASGLRRASSTAPDGRWRWFGASPHVHPRHPAAHLCSCAIFRSNLRPH